MWINALKYVFVVCPNLNKNQISVWIIDSVVFSGRLMVTVIGPHLHSLISPLGRVLFVGWKIMKFWALKFIVDWNLIKLNMNKILYLLYRKLNWKSNYYKSHKFLWRLLWWCWWWWWGFWLSWNSVGVDFYHGDYKVPFNIYNTLNEMKYIREEPGFIDIVALFIWDVNIIQYTKYIFYFSNIKVTHTFQLVENYHLVCVLPLTEVNFTDLTQWNAMRFIYIKELKQHITSLHHYFTVTSPSLPFFYLRFLARLVLLSTN